MTGVISMVLSATIANVAVPSSGRLRRWSDQAQWMATAFITTMTAGQLLSAYIIAAFGHSISMLIIAFTIGMMTAVTSTNITTLTIGRMIQGVCAGAIQPLVLVTVFGVFKPDQRGTAMGIFGMAIALAPGSVPRWRHRHRPPELAPYFFDPAAALFDRLCSRQLFHAREAEDQKTPPFDFIALSLGRGAVLRPELYCQWASIWMVLRSFAHHAIGCVGLLATFVWTQLKAEEPLLDLTLFFNKQFNAAVAVGVVFGAGNLALAMQCLFLCRPSKVSPRQKPDSCWCRLASC